jgi:hypothetical protein
MSLNQGAFGAAAVCKLFFLIFFLLVNQFLFFKAFALMSALLFLASGIAHLVRRRAPQRNIPVPGGVVY